MVFELHVNPVGSFFWNMIARNSSNAGKLAQNVHHHILGKAEDCHTAGIPDDIFFSLNGKYNIFFNLEKLIITAKEILAMHSSSESPIFE